MVWKGGEKKVSGNFLDARKFRGERRKEYHIYYILKFKSFRSYVDNFEVFGIFLDPIP